MKKWFTVAVWQCFNSSQVSNTSHGSRPDVFIVAWGFYY